MELWIRSQDKNILQCIDNVYIGKGTNKILSCKILNNTYIDFCLGEYKTKERALEVLDEIQGKITQNECLKTMIPKLNNVKGEEEKIGKLFKEMVYQMPKE